MKALFLGPGGLRAGWRLLIFLGLSLAVGTGIGQVVVKVFHLQPAGEWTAPEFLVDETVGGLGIVGTLVAAAIMTRIDRKSFSAYGLPLRAAFGTLFGQGALWGALVVLLLFGLIAAFGGVSLHGFALKGEPLARSALLWALAMILVGLSEEFLFRGYPQAALTDGIGFWPAAVLLSLIFGALHYFFKSGETVTDGVSVTLLGLFMVFTLRRTGSLWFAIGFHAAFDFAALPLLGAPNSGNGGKPIADHLLATSFHGPAWVTGGNCGMEASALVFVPIALLFILFDRRFRQVRFPADPAL